jgi:hypothetical protein
MSRSPRHRHGPSADRTRIREVFLRPRPLYAVSDVARVLRFAEDEVRRRIADGSVEAVDREGEPLVPWEELIAAAVDERWTPRLLAEALPPRAVPRLARSASGTIVLPLYLWKLLRAVARDLAAAEDRELTVSDLIERAVHREHVEEIRDWQSVEERIPGIRVAAVWPAARGRVAEDDD